MLIAMEDDVNQDVQPNERDTWQPLRTVSAHLLRRPHMTTRHAPVAPDAQSDPHENQNDDRREDRAGSDDDRRYVGHRLKEIAAFEERARGNVPKRRKTKT
jgi:hypothetical protein